MGSLLLHRLQNSTYKLQLCRKTGASQILRFTTAINDLPFILPRMPGFSVNPIRLIGFDVERSPHHVKGLFLGHTHNQLVFGNCISNLNGPFRMFLLQRNFEKVWLNALVKSARDLM